MVKSLLDGSVNFPEDRTLDAEDADYDASVYDSVIEGVPVTIALGQAKYAFIDKNIIYYPVYLVKDQKVDTQIGVYEVLADKVPNLLDEDGDLNISLMGRPLIYSFVTKQLLEEASTKPGPKASADSQADKDADKKGDKDADKKGDKDADKGDDDSDDGSDDPQGDEESMGYSPLPEQTKAMGEKEREEFKDGKRLPWIQKFFHNNNYTIESNEGGGDCLFASIRDALAGIGRDVSVADMRKILADNATEDLFQGYQIQYVSAVSELADVNVLIKDLAKQNRELKARMRAVKDRNAQAVLVAQGEEVSDRHARAKREKAWAQERIEEFKFMAGITTLEAFKAKLQTCDFWGETWALSTLERVLNIKLILFSREEYRQKDFDNVLQCGHLNDSVLEEAGTFTPTHYIMMNYLGWHYELIKFKDRGAFTFKELPYEVRKMIVTKCMESMAGPYYIIPEFREFMHGLQLTPTPPAADLSSDLHDPGTVFQFYSKSSDAPKPGAGAGESLGPEGVHEYMELGTIPQWRKKLSNFWAEEFELDGKKWLSVEHYYQASKFKKQHPDFYDKFSLDSGTPLSRDATMAKAAGGKTGIYRGTQVRDPSITVDDDFFTGRNKKEMESAMRAKFTQNPDLKRLLLATKKAKLQHFVRGRPAIVFDDLMRVRQELAAAASK